MNRRSADLVMFSIALAMPFLGSSEAMASQRKHQAYLSKPAKSNLGQQGSKTAVEADKARQSPSNDIPR